MQYKYNESLTQYTQPLLLVTDHGIIALDWPANLLDMNPIENLCGIGKMKDTRLNNTDEKAAVIKETWASITHQVVLKADCLHAVIHGKGAPTK